MLSRYALHSTLSDLLKTYSVITDQSEYKGARYNIGQGMMIPVIIAGKARDVTFVQAKWEGVAGAPPASTLAGLQQHEPQAFKLLSRNRCVIPMNGFFEWKVLSDSLKLPFYFRTLQRDMFGVAGLYSMLEDEGGKRHYACTTLEVSSNELLEPLSATMPAILDDSDIEQWLNPLQSDVAVVEKLLKPCKTNSMASFRVDNTVNSTEAEGDELIKPVV